MTKIEAILEKLVEIELGQASDRLALIEALNRLADSNTPNASAFDEFTEMARRKAQEIVDIEASSGHSGHVQQAQNNVYTHDLIIESGKQYTRQTHPLLFLVVDYLESNPQSRNEGVRKIADLVTQKTGQSVGKSWAAVAKNYWKTNQS